MSEQNSPRFEIVRRGPYRFVGKSVYARAFGNRGSGDIFGGLWGKSGWIFEELNKLNDYASDIPHNAALMTWDAYNDHGTSLFNIFVGKTELLGYCVGRFMKAGTPVPKGMDYIDIPEGYIAMGWIKGKGYDDDLDGMVRKELERQGYIQASWRFMAEIYPKKDDDGTPNYGYYISCNPKNPESDLTEEELAEKKEKAVKILKTLEESTSHNEPVKIDLASMKPHNTTAYIFTGELLKFSIGADKSGMATPQTFKGPIRINLRAMTDNQNIRM